MIHLSLGGFHNGHLAGHETLHVQDQFAGQREQQVRILCQKEHVSVDRIKQRTDTTNSSINMINTLSTSSSIII